MSRIVLLLAAFAVIAGIGHAQTAEFTRPHLDWRTFETKNFVVHYTDGLEEVAFLAADIAEEIHEPLCEIYEYRPDTKVSLIFSDEDDIANAGSYFQSNKIKFFATSMAWDFRGTHNWLRNVVTHEYTHMIQLGASRKWSRRFPAIYVQGLGYEPERRPDVLYGYPNTLISWPLPSVTIPAWFAEGTAQYQFSGSGYDFWDSHRDMLLRQAVLSNRLLSFEDMGFFGKTSLESEGVYNQGYALVKYIADHAEGAKTLGEISRKMAGVWPTTLNDAIAAVTNKAGIVWYQEWKSDLEQRYGLQRQELEPFFTVADTLDKQGFVGFYPRFSSDGGKLAFISNSGRDYFGQSSLYLHDFASDSTRLLDGGAQGGIAWLPDDSGILFVRRATNNPHGALLHDIYLYRFADKKSVRLSKGIRAESVDISPDGSTLVFTINEQGRRDLAFAEMPDVTGRIKPLTPDDLLSRLESLPHEQYYLPRWSPDGTRIAVAHHLKEGRSVRVFRYNPSDHSLALEAEVEGKGGELRDPSWSEDGRSLFVSYDESGIANIYKLDLESQSMERLTVVLGSALYPEFSHGRLAYSEFCGDGFRVCVADSPSVVRMPQSRLDEEKSYLAQVPRKDVPLRGVTRESQPYRPRFESLYWFPRIAWDYNKFKPGTYLVLNDVLDKLTFIGGAAVNKDREYDLYGLAEYREFYPTIFAEYFNVQRRLTSYFADSSRIIGEELQDSLLTPIYDKYRIRYRYNLNEISVGLGVPLTATMNVKTRATYDQYVAHNRFDDETSVSLTYFKGWSWKTGFYVDARRPGLLTEISPSSGYRGFVEYTRANHKFITDIEVGGDALGLQEIYDPNNYNLFEFGVERYVKSPFKHHSLEARLRGGYIDEDVDPFFYQYAGGLPGMRGYSFYSLGGTRTAVGTLTYRFPVIRRAAINLWPISLNRVYGSIFGDVGDAWTGDYSDRTPKKDVGAGLRMQLHSFFAYPTALSFDVAYGLDKFSVVEDDVRTDYGEEVRYYLTILFDFYTPIIPPARHPASCGCANCARY